MLTICSYHNINHVARDKSDSICLEHLKWHRNKWKNVPSTHKIKVRTELIVNVVLVERHLSVSAKTRQSLVSCRRSEVSAVFQWPFSHGSRFDKKPATYSDIDVKRLKNRWIPVYLKGICLFVNKKNFLLDGSDLFLFYIIPKGLILLICKQNNEDKVSTSAVTIKTSKKHWSCFHPNI